MNQLSRQIILCLLMLASVILSYLLSPTQKLADARPKIDLETMIPTQFGDWQIDTSIVPILASPDVQEKLDAIYNQVLARTYINSKNERVMLSISYGGDQSNDNYQVHRPEYCYKAQGFELTSANDEFLNTPVGELPIRRLEAFLDNRHEPITYWIVIGEKATLPGWGRKLAQMRYGLTGIIPDGMLVRVSSIMDDDQKAYGLQEQFISMLLMSVDPSDLYRVTGNKTKLSGKSS